MKIPLSFLISLISYNLCFAQNEGVLNYKLITRNTIGNNEVSKVIYFKGVKSIEFGVPKKVESVSEKKSETEYKEVMVIKSKKPGFILKDLKNKHLFLADHILNKFFLISDTLNNFNWKITSEHKKVLNYNCTKAITNFRGRSYTAWFSEQIPLQFGPWKFWGLPGLIIKVSDAEDKFIYELNGIDLRAKVNIHILNIPSEYKDDKPLLHSQFIDIYNKKVADYSKMSKIVYTFPDGGTAKATISIPEEQEKF